MPAAHPVSCAWYDLACCQLHLHCVKPIHVSSTDLLASHCWLQPSAGGAFDYTADAYTSALSQFVEKVGLSRPFAVVVQGYVLGQFGLLWALENAGAVWGWWPWWWWYVWADCCCACASAGVVPAALDSQSAWEPFTSQAIPPHHSPLHPSHTSPPTRPPDSVAKLVILNTPLSTKTPLRPELGAYKSPLPFLRPKAGTRFQADIFNAAGGPYAMSRRDADAYLGTWGWRWDQVRLEGVLPADGSSVGRLAAAAAAAAVPWAASREQGHADSTQQVALLQLMASS